MKAIDFELPDEIGIVHRLSDYLGQWVVVYFYPKDDTPGCTKEACNFRDGLDEFRKNKVVVLGISKDTVKSHGKFSQKFGLNFPLLSDEKKEVIRAYGALEMKKFMGREYEGVLRKTFLINPKGEVAKVFDEVDVNKHAKEILDEVKLQDGTK